MTAHTVALILGGAVTVWDDIKEAELLCEGLPKSYFAVKDMVHLWQGPIDHAVTLHPEWITKSLHRRKLAGYMPPGKVWAHRLANHVTHATTDWGGSSGLLGVKIALEQGHRRIICCGIPMQYDIKHVEKPGLFNAAKSYQEAWRRHYNQMNSYVKSMSGWSATLLGKPTREWVASE